MFFLEKKDSWRRNVPKFRNDSKRKVFQSHLFVINLIWLILIITHGELTVFYNPFFKYLTGYAKPKETNGNWVKHLFRKQDVFTNEGYMIVLFNSK